MTLSQATAPTKAPVAAPSAIAVRGLGKRFHMPAERHTSVRQHILHPFASRSAPKLTALSDISFDVDAGSCLGIVGRNGCGKSTLLRCVSGIYVPDQGEVLIRGRLAAFIELGVGFDRELTARDNVITNGMLFGLSGAEVRSRLEEIIDYAGLEGFADVKLKNYSSGMAMRLAFALTTHVDADVLLFDEAIATGDLAFQAKCLERFEQLRAEGRTVVFVSHDMGAIQTLCDRALLLESGRVVFEGDGATVADRYDAINLGQDPGAESTLDTRRRQRSLEGRPEPPTALAGSLRVDTTPSRGEQARNILRIASRFAALQYKLKYADAALGYAWAVMRPLAVFAAMYVVFTKVAHLDRRVPHYAIYLLCGLVLWTSFLDATTNGTFSLVSQAELLRKVPVPRAAMPLAVVLRAQLDLLMNLVIVLVFVALSHIAVRASWLELPFLGLGVAVLSAGIALLLSALYVRLRDVDQVWAVLAQVLFFASCILYVIDQLPAGVRRPMILFNPLATIFTQIRHALIDPHAPSAAAVAGGRVWLLVPVAVTVVIVTTGVMVFRRMVPSAAEYL